MLTHDLPCVCLCVCAGVCVCGAAELGFKGTVLAPYSVVPAGSTLQYEVELIRLSNRGPDELTKVSYMCVCVCLCGCACAFVGVHCVRLCFASGYSEVLC